MTSVPTGKCGPCCSVAASGNTAIHRAGASPDTSGQWMSVQSRGGRVEVIERNVSYARWFVLMRKDATRIQCFPIMGQNDRRSPIMNPALLPRALTVALVAVL